MILQSDEKLAENVLIFHGSEKDVEKTEDIIDNLKSIVGDELLEHHFLSTEEIAKRGYILTWISMYFINGHFLRWSERHLKCCFIEVPQSLIKGILGLWN